MMAEGVVKEGRRPNRIRSARVLVRTLPEWKGWIGRLAEHDGAASVAELMDRAMVAYGQKVRFPERAPRR
jgi:hypothetical protein